MTDINLADATYLEPITVEALIAIIDKERPNALLPTVGGQTALDITIELDKKGILDKYNIELIGANIDAIQDAEDREKFKLAMNQIGTETAKGGFASSIKSANKIINDIPFPVIIRPSFTMGGTGGSVAYINEEFNQSLKRVLTQVQFQRFLLKNHF